MDAAAADKILQEDTKHNHFRVTIFGSARIKKGDHWYKEVFHLAKNIAKQDVDIVTGGGPGIMEAANEGHYAGRRPESNAHSIGMTIQLPWENEPNEYLDVQRHFHRFSNRLDYFMALSHVVVVMPGGIGTCLELFYTWQLTQVHHMLKIPIILRGRMWNGLVEWVKKEPVARGLVSPEDMDNIYVVKNSDEALEIIYEYHQKFLDPKNTEYRKKYTLESLLQTKKEKGK